MVRKNGGKTMKPPCYYYHCPECPYNFGPFCFYEKKERFIINGNFEFEDKIDTFEINVIYDSKEKEHYFLIDTFENTKKIVKKLNILTKDELIKKGRGGEQ